MIYLM